MCRYFRVKRLLSSKLYNSNYYIMHGDFELGELYYKQYLRLKKKVK